MLETRVRVDWFGREEVPSLRFEHEGVAPGDEALIEAEPGEPFRALELDVELGGSSFHLRGVTVDGEDQLLADVLLEHGSGPLSFPFAEKIAVRVKNVSEAKASLRFFMLGRTKRLTEKEL